MAVCVKENLPVLTGYTFCHSARHGLVQGTERDVM